MMGLSQQQHIGREAVQKVLEFTRQKQMEQDRFTSEMHSRLEQVLVEKQSLSQELSSTRQEMSQLRSLLDQKFDASTKDMSKANQEIDALKKTVDKVRSDNDNLHLMVQKIDHRLSTSARAADSNLVKVGKVLLDYNTLSKDLEAQQRAKLETELQSRLEASMQWLKEEEERQKKEIQAKFGEFLDQMGTDRRKIDGLEEGLLRTLDDKVAQLDSWTKSKIESLHSIRDHESSEILNTITALKNYVLSGKKKEKEQKELFAQMLQETREDILSRVESMQRTSESRTVRKDPSFLIL